MLDRMTPEMFDEWCAKDLIEPIGYGTQMLGFIAYMLSVYMSKGEDGPKMDDLMPWLKTNKSDHTGEQAKAKQMILAAIGGR